MLSATVVVQKLDPKAKIPCKPKSFHDAGWDVFPIERVIIPAGCDALLGTGLKVSIPNGFCIQVNPRSGKAVKNKLLVGARVVDAQYRGELKIHIFNHSKQDYEVSPHDPIAQLLVLPCASLLVEGTIEDTTDRGADGFGSTDGKLKYDSMHSQVPAAAEAVQTFETFVTTRTLEQPTALSPKFDGNVDALINQLANGSNGAPTNLTNKELAYLHDLVVVYNTLPNGYFIKK